jgi:hypothetical protein
MKSERGKLSRAKHPSWIEGLAIALGLLGLALILAPDRLHDLLFSSINWMKVGANNDWVAFNHFLDQLTLARLAGVALLVAVAALLAWQLRSRLAESTRLRATTCPACGGDLHRIHRSSLDRLAGRLSGLPLRRYRCSDTSCGWQGLLRRREHQLRGSE